MIWLAPAWAAASMATKRLNMWSFTDMTRFSVPSLNAMGWWFSMSWKMKMSLPRTDSRISVFTSPLAKKVWRALILKRGGRYLSVGPGM